MRPAVIALVLWVVISFTTSRLDSDIVTPRTSRIRTSSLETSELEYRDSRQRHRYRHRRHRKPHPKYDRTGGCIYEHGGDNKVLGSPTSGAWLEYLPFQQTVYDRLGNVVKKFQFWETGCWMVIERCNFTGEVCVPGSTEKWRFGGCNWTSGSTCVPSKDHWREGTWMKFRECTGGTESGTQQEAGTAHCDHTYAK